MRSTEGVTVTWAQDSSEGFNLSLAGIGIPFDRTEPLGATTFLSYYGWQPLGDAFPSPSGQWIIQAGLNVQIFRNTSGVFTGLDYQMMGNVWNTVLDDGFLLLDSADRGFVRPHYSELMTEKYQSGDIFASWETVMATDLYGTQLDNPATWAWTLKLSGNQVPHNVPDAGSTAALLGMALVGLGFVRRR